MIRFAWTVILALTVPAFAQAPWASTVMSYSPGAGVAPGYDNPTRALGEPTRFTGVGFGFPGAVTPFNPAFEPTELVSIGFGGSLVVRFDTPIHNNPLNPFGIDLLIFGNAGYVDTAFPAGVAGPMFGVGGGAIEVSTDGVNWHPVPGVVADAAFPTLGYLDLSDPYSIMPGSVLSDFTRPVNPSLNAAGLSFAQIVAAYDGSGGGTGVDLAAIGLATISYVRITNTNPNVTVDIDAFAAVTPVPAPGTLGAFALASLMAARRKRTLR
jgi:hypothetical protein